MPYGLVVNGQLRDLGDIKYLLSPQVTHQLTDGRTCLPNMRC